MSEPELKPCPFCGGAEVRAQQNGLPRNRFWECACDDCDFCGPAFDTKDEAVSHWNTRADLAEMAAAFELAADEIAASFIYNITTTTKSLLDIADIAKSEARALTPDDAKAALDSMLKAEREKALREVLSKISGWTDQKHIAEDMKHGGFPNRTTQAYAIERIVRALIDHPTQEGEG